MEYVLIIVLPVCHQVVHIIDGFGIFIFYLSEVIGKVLNELAVLGTVTNLE